MTEHPPPADLDRLVQGTLSADERHRLLEHLLRRCPHCCSALAHFGGFAATGEEAGVLVAEDYQGALDRAFARASRFAAPRQQAANTVASLLAGADRWAGGPAPEPTSLRGLPRVQGLLEAARGLRYEDPQAMLRFAKLGRCATDRLRMRDYGRKTVADLRALAWAELASAYRVCNELGRADHAMNRAIYWCKRGSQSDLLVARVADLLASLLAYQRRFPEGRELLAIVCRIHAEAGNRHLAGRALVKLANLTSWEGNHRKALLLMRRGFDLLDPGKDPRLGVQTLSNMIWLLMELGRYRSARRFLWQSRVVLTGVVESHRLRWLEARIFAGLSDFSRAEPAFQQARAGFIEEGQVYPAALVGLDLAALWARQGRVKDVFELAEEMIVTFRALRIAREAISVLLVLKRACLHGGQLLALIGTAIDLLENLERQPTKPRNYSGSPPSGSPAAPSF
jgi:tetratricopeptide (TPR) repeat protein